ncbi:MAG TPA: DUF2804 family protein, partial [Solirubrobacteraceae bacterium]|nr:DUF2804 family protein [Solirubrobacteraceae bacterium]
MTGQSIPGSITAAEQGASAGARQHPIPTRLFRGSRPLKRWRYVGVFSDEIMACAALVRIGPARQSFWALNVRAGFVQRERTRLLPRRSEVELIHGRAADDSSEALPGRLRVRDLGVTLDLQLEEGAPIEALCPHGAAEVWTRKQAGVRAHGTLALDGGAPRTIEALAVIDDTAGHHARETEWWWSAGVGESPDGVA